VATSATSASRNCPASWISFGAIPSSKTPTFSEPEKLLSVLSEQRGMLRYPSCQSRELVRLVPGSACVLPQAGGKRGRASVFARAAPLL